MSKLDLKVKVAEGFEKLTSLPKYQTEGAACFDLVAAKESVLPIDPFVGPLVEYDTGLQFEIPKGHVGLIFPRSSITTSTSLVLGNGVGVIDSDYRGTIKFQYRNINQSMGKKYKVGDRIGQMMILPIPMVNIVGDTVLSETDRGEEGFGSTGE